MTTYKTINEAYENATGNVCFQLNNEYILVSRQSSISFYEELKNDCLRYVDDNEVKKIIRQELRNINK
jgi:hypothetical protein